MNIPLDFQFSFIDLRESVLFQFDTLLIITVLQCSLKSDKAILPICFPKVILTM